MARKAKTDGAAPAPSKPTLEALSEDQVQALAYQHKKHYESALAAKKAGDAGFKNVCKLARAEIGADAIDIIKDLIAFETEEGEAKIRASVERQLRTAKWAGAELGSQFEMFDGSDRTPLAERARAAGKRAGLAGEPKKPPHDPSTEAYREWMAGFDEGQKVVVETHIKPGQPSGIGDQPATHRMM